MRLLVMFDLPTGNSSERKSYARFRKFLINDGYYMEQFSVYSRILSSRDRTQSHLDRLRANLPSAGAVTALLLTEKQYENRVVLVDTRCTRSYEQVGPQLTISF
jgi:CRISPR-associated protein Cas2